MGGGREKDIEALTSINRVHSAGGKSPRLQGAGFGFKFEAVSLKKFLQCRKNSLYLAAWINVVSLAPFPCPVPRSPRRSRRTSAARSTWGMVMSGDRLDTI
jgi:hypothetical protein